jgi:hypothetical protein
MGLKPVRLFFLLNALLLSACSANGASSPNSTGASMMPSLLTDSNLASSSYPTPKRHKLNLYVASAQPYFFDEYSLPLRQGEQPVVTETGVNEPVPIADDGHNLYVGSYDDSTIYTYPLPLSPASQRTLHDATTKPHPYVPPFAGKLAALSQPTMTVTGAVDSGVGDPSGLAVNNGYLYVAGDEVLAYKLPLVPNEVPAGSITGAGSQSFDAWSVCAQGDMLYVASVVTGTVTAYHLPLKLNATAQYSIPTLPQSDGAMSVAVDRSGAYLYVSLYDPGLLYQYALPYRNGETPTVVHINSQTQGRPYGIAIGDRHLFVTASNILDYRLPLTSSSRPAAVLRFQSNQPGDLVIGE